MRILTILFALFLTGALAHPADAQKAGRVEKVKKRLRAMRAAALIEGLDLDEAGATKLMPVLDKFDDDFAKLAKENLELRAKLETETDDTKLDALIDDLVANQRARWDLDEARFKEIRKVLTKQQAAQILILLPEIDRKILAGVQRALAKQEKKAGRQKARKARADGKIGDPSVEP